MSINREQICRICLKGTKEECKDVDETVRLMFDILSLKLDLDIARDPIVCLDCLEVAKICLDFKYTCISTERVILSFAIAKKKAKDEIKVICKKGKDVEAVVDEYINICRFCKTHLRTNDFVSLNILMDGNIFDMLSGYLPEVDFNIIENPKICTTCKETLQGNFWFVLHCLDTETKIKSYCKEERSNNMHQIELSNVLDSWSEDIFQGINRCSQIRNIKQNSNRIQDIEVMNSEAYNGLIKQEELDIKEEGIEEYTYKPMVKANVTKDGSVIRNDLEVKRNECSSLLRGSEMNICRYSESVSDVKDKNNASKTKIYKAQPIARDGNYKRNFKRHKMVHKDISEIKMFKCSLCAYETKRKGDLKSHTLVHKDVSEIKMFKCSFCTYEGKRKINLTKHMFTHKRLSETEMVKRPLCHYEYKCRTDLKSHMLVHKDISEVEMFKCALCAYESKRKSGLKTHMFVHKDLSEVQMFKCSLCTYQGKQKRQLTKHMLIHKSISEIEMFKCSCCAYESKYKDALKRHMLVHKNVSEIKMYKCELCTFEAKRKNNIQIHMLVHKDVTEIEMFTCSLCSYETKCKSYLKTHMLTHKDISEIKTFKCSICTYEGKQKSHLASHMFTHKNISEIKMYKCLCCPYKTKYKGNLTQHRLVHKDVSEINMHKCLLCGFEAKRKIQLKRHIILIHGHFKNNSV